MAAGGCLERNFCRAGEPAVTRYCGGVVEPRASGCVVAIGNAAQACIRSQQGLNLGLRDAGVN